MLKQLKINVENPKYFSTHNSNYLSKTMHIKLRFFLECAYKITCK